MPFFRRGNSLGLQTEEKKEEKKDEVLPFVTPSQLSDMSSSIRTEVQNTIGNAVAELRGMFQGFQQPQRQEQQVQTPTIPDITDDEYQEALQTGDVARLKVREQANMTRMRQASQMEINQARSEFTPVVESMAGELAGTILASLPYYALFKKEVDELLKTIPAAQRNRSVIEHIYHSVCGRPESLEKITEHRTRQQQQADTERAMASDSSRSNRQGQQRSESITFESTFGQGISNPTAALQGGAPLWQGRRRGYDPETYAKDIGFQGKDDYARFTHAVMSIEDCGECLTPVVGGHCAPYCRMNKMRGAA